MDVRDFIDGHEIEQPLLLRSVEARTTRAGGEFLRLQLADRTGSVCANVWDPTPEHRELCTAGVVLHVRARYEIDQRYGGQLRLRTARPARPDEYDPEVLHDGPPRSATQMEADLRALIDTVQDPHLRHLLDRIFGPGTE